MTNTPAPPPDDALHWPLASVLVVDDERGMRSFLERALAPRVAQVCCAADADEAQALVQTHHFDLVILDVALPGKNGIEWLRELRAQQYSAEVILITAYADLDTAIEALRAGANDFILKPFRVTQVLNAVKQRLEKAHLARENWVLRRDLSRHVPSLSEHNDGLVGSSIVVQGLKAALRRVASVASTVLLTGESGTGKELAALALHRQSARAAGPFVPINCATMLPDLIESELFGQAPRRSGDHQADRRDGLFVYAQGGTLFLDGIAELPLPQQATLLRVLEERKVRPVGSQQEIAVDVRIVAASNRPLADEVAAGRFRQDLYYRLQVVEIRLAPLRAHKEDIAELVQHFIATLAPQLGVAPISVSEHELDFLRQYDWPGNVRELRNLIERSLILGSLNVSALYPGGQREAGAGASAGTGAGGTGARSAPTDLLTLERQHIQGVLASVDGDKTEAARLLGISRRTLERRVADWAQES